MSVPKSHCRNYVMSSGKLFQATGAATENARLPSCTFSGYDQITTSSGTDSRKVGNSGIRECTSRSDNMVQGRALNVLLYTSMQSFFSRCFPFPCHWMPLRSTFRMEDNPISEYCRRWSELLLLLLLLFPLCRVMLRVYRVAQKSKPLLLIIIKSY